MAPKCVSTKSLLCNIHQKIHIGSGKFMTSCNCYLIDEINNKIQDQGERNINVENLKSLTQKYTTVVNSTSIKYSFKMN